MHKSISLSEKCMLVFSSITMEKIIKVPFNTRFAFFTKRSAADLPTYQADAIMPMPPKMPTPRYAAQLAGAAWDLFRMYIISNGAWGETSPFIKKDESQDFS